ncbi:MAG: putative integral membrane protein [Psychromonas sp.]|jgi:uncharacterized integral membrane protein
MKDYWDELTNWQKTKLILKVILYLLVGIFCIRNWHSTDLNLVIVTFKIPLTVIIVASLGLGYLLAKTLTQGRIAKMKKQIKELVGEETNNQTKKEEV